MKTFLSLFCGIWLLSSCLASTGSAQSLKPGTEIHVQLVDQLDTGKAQGGEEFSGTLAEPVRLENDAVWPKGTEVTGRVVEVVSSGRLKRPASITLQLTQIGNSPIATETEQFDGKSHAGRNVALIGGGATAGAIVGAIAGGAKGAVIGTAVGAGAGTATAAATGKQEIILSPETQLVFVVAGNAPIEPEASGPVPEANEANQPQDEYQDPDNYEPYTQEQLDNLVAPIALYPDPLLAQVLVAATFPDQIHDAAWWIRANNPNDVDYQPWDVSVKAVAHYPTVLAMLNDRLDWTTALGQAYVYQSTDVTMSVQRLRNLAYRRGNLITTPQQRVIVDRGYIQIVPSRPRVIFVPVYDPEVIYIRRVYRPGIGFGGFFTFGRGFLIGAWLNYDMDWASHRVVYAGWERHHRGWRGRSRPYVHITNVYVNNRHERVIVNRNVMNRHVDYDNVRRFNSVHRDVTYENRARFQPDRARHELPRVRQHPQWQPPNERGEDRGEDRGSDRGARNRQSFQERSRWSKHPKDATFERKNQTPPEVEQPQRHPSYGRENVDGRGDDREEGRGARNQRPVHQIQPARTAPQPPPQNTPIMRPGAHPSNHDQSRTQQQQKEQSKRGPRNEVKDNNNGKDKKEHHHED